MATPAAVLSILLEANTGKATSQLRGMQGQLQQVNRHATDTERASGKLGKTMSGLSAPTDKASRSMGGLAKGVLAAGGAFVAFEAAKNAIQSTVQLGEATIKLTAITGLDAKQASTWIEVMAARGVQTKAVSMAFITLSRQIEHAGAGSKASVEAFKALGIAAKTLPGKSTEENLLRVADGLKNLKSPAERAAIAQQLFGRGAQALIPVLAQGRSGVDAMLASAQRYGAFLPNNIKRSQQMIETQFQLNYAMDGLKIAFTEAVLPILVEGANKLLAFIAQMRDGTGAGGQFANALKTAFNIVKGVITTVVGAVGGLGNAVKLLLAGFAVSKIVAFSRALQGLFSVTSGTGAIEKGMAGSLLSGARLGVSRILKGATFAGIGLLLSQVVGSSIHGAAGKALSAIGTGASIGGGLGMVFGPWGAAAGAAIGAGVGGAIHLITSHGPSDGQKWATAFLSELPAQIQTQFDKGLAKAKDDAKAAQNVLTLSPKPGQGPGALSPQQKAAETAARQKAFFQEGQLAAQATVAGLKSVKVPTTGILTSDFITKLRALDPQARNEAAKVMLTYANQLVTSGKLPKDAVQKMIQGIEGQFPGLRLYLQQKGLQTGTDFAHAMRFQAATDQLKRTLEQYRKDFGDWQIRLNATTFTQLWQNMRTAMRHLHDVMTNPDTLPAARKAAAAEFQHLRDQANQIMKGAVADLHAHLGDIKSALRDKGLRAAAGVAAKAFVNLQSAVASAVSSGVISVNTGNAILAKALQQELSAFGSKDKIPAVTAIGTAAISAQATSTASKIASSFATGGLVQVGRKGAGGRDNVPMNVGGVPIVVGEGEQVAVFTRHQQAVANQALAGYGGLPGLFSKVNKPNYMATGGYVYPFPAGTTIGRTDEGIDASMPVGSPIGAIGPAQVMGIHPDWYKSQPLVWEKLTAGPMTGRLIYLAEQITSIASGTLTANQALARFASSGTGIEMGWADSTGYPAAASHYTEGQVTAEGTDFRNFIMGLAHGVITGGGGTLNAGSGPVWKNIAVPKVQGSGTVPAIVRADIAKATAVINAWGSSKLGSAALGSVGGTGSITAANLAAIAKSLGYNWDGTQIHDWLTIISQESGGNPTAQNPTSTAYGIGQFLDSTWGLYGTSAKTSDPHLQLVDMAKYIHGKYGTPAAAEAYHLAHNSYAQGGLLPQFFASGGLPLYSGFGSNWVGPRSRQTPPKPKGGTNIGLKQLAGKDMGPINKAMGELNNLIGDTGDIAKLQERYQAFDSLFQALHPNLQYLVQPADGSAAYIDDAAVQDSLAELLQLQAWEQQIIGDYQRVQKLAPEVLKAIDTAIKVRRRAIEQLKAKIRANLQRIAALEKLITVAQKAKNTTLVAQYKKQVGVLKSDNATLGGSATSVGTTGRIGALSAEITALQDRSGKAGDMLVSAQGITGAGGGLATENVNLIGLQQQIKPLQDWVTSKGGSLAVQLQQAAAPAQDSNLQAQLALQEQLTTAAQQALGVSQAQYQALEGLPFAGSFGGGGIVPGPVGAPAVAVVHGGERIGTLGNTNVNIHFANGMEWLRQFITVEVSKRDRGTGRTVGRGLPGAGGGI